MSIDKGYSSSISTFAQRVATELENRQRALLTDGRNIGFTETKQDEILQRDGKYDMQKFFTWADKKGLDSMNLDIISSGETELIKGLHTSPNKQEAVDTFKSLFNILNQYGNELSRGYEVAYQNIYDNLDRRYRNDFINMIASDGRFDVAQIEIVYLSDKEDI